MSLPYVVKERPILFSGPMVRSILDGQKSQTRRPVNKLLTGCFAEPNWSYGDGSNGRGWYVSEMEYPEEGSIFVQGPYGQVGDQLWVRETAFIAPPNFADPMPEWPRDDQGRPRCVSWAASTDSEGERCARDYGVKKTPSIHMPRWASRITLEITGVRVERLQEISEEDAKAEGCQHLSNYPTPAGYTRAGAFAQLWDQIYFESNPWHRDPWVWVVEFKRVKP